MPVPHKGKMLWSSFLIMIETNKCQVNGYTSYIPVVLIGSNKNIIFSKYIFMQQLQLRLLFGYIYKSQLLLVFTFFL